MSHTGLHIGGRLAGKLKGKHIITEQTAYGVLAIIACSHLLNDMLQSVVPAVYPILKESYGLSFVQIGIITFLLQLTSSIIQPFVGLYADRRPRPYSLAWGMCFTLVGLGQLAWAASFASILVAVCCIGIGSAVFHPEASRVAQMASGGKKGLAQSIFQVGGNGGSSLGPLLAALVVLPYGQHSIGLFALVAIVACLLLVHIGGWYSARLAYCTAHHTPPAQATHGLSPHMVRCCMGMLVVLIFSKYFYTACITNYFTFYLIEKFHVSVQTSQLCLFAYLAAFAIGTLVGGMLGDRYGRKYVILGSIFGSAPFALLLPYANLLWTMVLVVLVGLVISSAFSAILVYATDLMPDKVGVIAGVFFGLMFGLGGVASALFGWLADCTSITHVFHLSCYLPLLGVVAVFLPNIKGR